MLDSKTKVYLHAFMKGFGSMLKVTPHPERKAYHGPDEDLENLRADWVKVGNYIREGQGQYEREQQWRREERVSG